MGSLTGVKLLSSAMVFGVAAIVFTMVPFLIVLIRGIIRARDNSTGGANFVNVVFLAFIVHVISTITFMATILILDIFSQSQASDGHFFSRQVIGIFWAETQADAFSMAGITDRNANEALAAWTTLNSVQTVTRLMFMCIPIVVILSAMAYGVGLSTKDTYRQDYLTVIIYAGVSMIAAMVLYIAWAGIASAGLFLPTEYGNGNLLTYIGGLWGDTVLKGL